MDLDYSGDTIRNGGSGGLATGMALGNMMHRRDDYQASYIWAVIVFIIFVVIALVFLAFMRRDDHRKDYAGTDIAALLTPLIAAKSMECNPKNNEIDKFEILNKIEHSDDRRMMEKTQAELGALGLMLQKTAADNEMKNLEQFGEVKAKLGMLEMGVGTILQERNNAAIIQGVVNQLMLGKACLPSC